MPRVTYVQPNGQPKVVDVPAGTTVMGRLAKGYSDEQIAALAAHFSKISANAPAAAPAKKKGK